MERTAICEKDGDTASALLLKAAERRTEDSIMVKYVCGEEFVVAAVFSASTGTITTVEDCVSTDST
jgi:hypothetical protein